MAEEIVEVGPEGMALRDLAYVLAVNEAEVIKALFMKGVAVSVTQTLAVELVEMVCEDYETEVLRVEVRASPASTLVASSCPPWLSPRVEPVPTTPGCIHTHESLPACQRGIGM